LYVKDLTGKEYAVQMTHTIEGELNANVVLSGVVYPSNVNKVFIDDIGEMWTITDFEDVEHKIIYCKRRGEGDLLSVEIKAIPLFFDEMDTSRIYEEYNEHMTSIVAFGRVFEDTNFTFSLVDSFDAVNWEGFGAGESKLETFKRCLERYKAEFKIVGNIVYLYKQVGRDTQFQYRYRLNASDIVQEVDANDMWTYAKGYADYDDGEDEGWQTANITEDYSSPLINIIGKRDAPPIKDGRIKSSSELQRRLKALVDESLKISITADIHDLRKRGYALAQPELGDRVFVIDERIDLQEEVRVIDMSITKNWRGDVIDLSVTFGSEGLSKRHQSNLNTAIKDITDIMAGRKKIPLTAYDNAVIGATNALKRMQSELVIPENGGLMAVDKNNPNNIVLFNAAGVGISEDGGATFKTAMTGQGLIADVITAGTLDASQVVIRGGSATEYAFIQGNEIETRGTHTRTWFGDTTTEDVGIQLRYGRLRMHNYDNNRNLYFSDRGISTYIGGSDGEDDGYAGSGTIEFFSYRYDPDRRGLTLYSNRGTIALETDTRDIVLNAERYLIIEKDNIYTDRISTKASSDNFYVGVSGDNDGELRVTNKQFWQGSHSNTRYMPIRSRGVHGKWFVAPDNFLYLGSDDGVRVTSRGVNNNDPIIYRDIFASDFQQRSSRESKTDIRKCERSGLESILKTDVVEFDYIDGQTDVLGAIAEDTELSKDGEFISISNLAWNNTLAIQEIHQILVDKEIIT